MWRPFQKKMHPDVEPLVIKNEDLEGILIFIRTMSSIPGFISDAGMAQEMKDFISSTERRAEELLVKGAELIRKESPDRFKIYQNAAREGKRDSTIARVFFSSR